MKLNIIIGKYFKYIYISFLYTFQAVSLDEEQQQSKYIKKKAFIEDLL